MSSKTSKKSTYKEPSKNLREQLLKLEPAGQNGFEGLIATALADLTGLTFRLAKSGSQFGRDASTPRARFAIAMEAKRYTDSLRLEDVAGKIWIASNELASNVDVWVLCATSEMGDGGLPKLEQMLEEKGISLLMLDWTGAPLPRLTVLLAATRSCVKQWFESHTSSTTAETIDAELQIIETNAAFNNARDQLLRDISAGHSGLAALADVNQVWSAQVFSDRTSSRSAFGQYLTVLDDTRPVIVRSVLNTELSTALNVPGCVAILGPEGVGKSWLVANWWATSNDKPILIMGGAWIADQIDSKEPLKTLARLIATQCQGDPSEQTERWLRRLKRWQEHGSVPNADQLRFLVVLDGLNERSGMPWADTILRLASEVEKLGGCLVLTCRERFWEREIVPRLAGITIKTVRVGDYTLDELDELLKQRGIAIETIPSPVRDFIRNPRICSIAIDFLDDLSAQVDELTVERLLMEYWQRRLKERGDLTTHSISDFDKLLSSHAKQFREDPNVQFDRDDWREHSGAAKRGDGRSVENDLADIEEGAFLRIVPDRDGFYEFKPDTVPFALGLLIVQELQDELRKPNRNPAEVIESIVEEIQGFDLVGEALRAASGISCFKEKYPPEGRAGLISAWLQLQNIPDSAYDSLVAYVAACPKAILDATEIEFDESASGRRRDWLVATLLQKRNHQNVEPAINSRINQWLGRWSPVPRSWGGRDERENNRLREQVAQILDKLNNLTTVEKDFLTRACSEVDSPEAAQLDSVAAILMAGNPQADYAEGLLAWAFTLSITHDYRHGEADLCWSIRLNTTDFTAFELKLRGTINALLDAPHSSVSAKAAAIALRVLGTVNGASEADQLDPREFRKGCRAVENYCATDPFDPNSVRPSNLETAIHAANSLNQDELWKYFSSTQENNELEQIIPGLARFEPDVLVQILHSVCKTIETRSQLSLRQLSWNLPRLSPLFDNSTLEHVLAGYMRLVQQPNLVAANDKSIVAGFILLSLLPHYSANDQLELFLKLPVEVGEMYAFRDVFTALDAMEIERALIAAESDPIQLRRTCFFISAHRPNITDRSCEIISQALNSDDPLVVTCASDVAFIAEDKLLDELVIAVARQREFGKTTRETFYRDRAIAAAVASLNLVNDISLISPPFIGLMASKLGGELANRLEVEIEQAVERLLKPIQANEPHLGKLYLDIDQTGREPMLRVVDRAQNYTGDAHEELQTLLTSPSLDAIVERQRTRSEEVDNFIKQLETEGAEYLIQEPNRLALARLTERNQTKATALANRILAEKDHGRLSAVRNFALALAEALADKVPILTANLLNHLSDTESPVKITFGDAHIPQEAITLFVGPDVEALTTLRKKALRQAKSDAELQILVFAAEQAGHTSWLKNWIAYEVATDVPGHIARGLMAEGLRDSDYESSPLLSRDWGPGFLGEVAKHARFAYERNVWAKTWSSQAFQATNPSDFWRCGELTVGIADIRACHWFDLNVDTPLVQRFGKELFGRIRSASEKRTQKREETLFGLKKPDRILIDSKKLSS
jgi:hypothetical protein